MGAIVETIDRLCWTDVEKAELRPAAVEAVGRDADVGRRVDEAFPEVEVDGESVEVAAWRSRVEAGVGGAPGAVLVLRGGGPVQEGSGGSVAVVEVCRSDVRLEESVALRGGAVGWAELGSESTRWEESVKMDNPPPKQQQVGSTSTIEAEHGELPVLAGCPRHHAGSAFATLAVGRQPGDDDDPIGRPAVPERRARFIRSSTRTTTAPQTGFSPQSCDSGAAGTPRTDPRVPSECTSEPRRPTRPPE